MKRKYAEGLTRQERHRVSDAIYRMKKVGFRFPESFDPSKITRVGTYNEIMENVVEDKNVLFQPFRKKVKHPYLYETPVSGKIAVMYLEESKKWNQERTKMKKGGVQTTLNVPKYDIKGVGPSVGERMHMTAGEIRHKTEIAMLQQIEHMREWSPEDYKHIEAERTRSNLKMAIENSIINSPGLKQLLITGYNNISDEKLAQMSRVNRKMFEAQFEYFDGWLLGGDTGEPPVLVILKSLGYDINMVAPDGVNGESIAEYIQRRNILGMGI